MSNIGSNSIIFKLKNQWAQLQDDVKELVNNRSKVYKKYEQSIIKTQETKKEQLQKWKQMEHQAVEQEYKGELYSIDCDAKRETEENFKKISEMIYLKADMIIRQFPEAASYFVSQGYDFPFETLRKQIPDPNIPKIVAYESNIPLIGKEVLKEDLYNFTDNEIETPDGLQKSGSISIQIGNLPAFSGKISDIQDNVANLTVGGETAPIYINTVRFGEVKCTKV